ncbi:hypothetical protein FQR65_LT17402 [Abscondita terminalis]|nr:hypothetical protein FQR65_LT17402 [Abscondita terminalis]
MEWSKCKVSKLIELYEQKTVLWNITSSHHKNSNSRHDALQRISQVMECSITEVEKKLHNLRFQYMREKSKIEESTKSGAGAKDVMERIVASANLTLGELALYFGHHDTPEEFEAANQRGIELLQNLDILPFREQPKTCPRCAAEMSTITDRARGLGWRYRLTHIWVSIGTTDVPVMYYIFYDIEVELAVKWKDSLWDESSDAMEAFIIVKDFKQSETMDKLKFMRFIADGN